MMADGESPINLQLITLDENLTIIVDEVQGRSAPPTEHHGGGNAAQRHPRPFRQRTCASSPAQLLPSQVEQVQLNNLADMRIDEDAISGVQAAGAARSTRCWSG